MSTKDKIGWALIAYGLFSFFQGGSVLPTPVAPAPIDAPGLHVLLIEETDDRDTIDKGQLAVLQTTQIQQDVKAAGGQFKQYDANNPPEAEPWKSAMSRPRQSTPWLIVSNQGKGGFEGAVPSGDGAIEATMKIIGGLK